MKYDDASWHYGGDFPKDLPHEAGATHIGMFVAWCLLNDLGGELHVEELPDLFGELKRRVLTPAQFFIKACDEKFTDEDLSDEGNEFAKFYYEPKEAQYIPDYESVLGVPGQSTYHIADTWENFDKLAPVVHQRYADWKKQKG